MLNSLHVENFRLFKDFQINDLARVNLIVGKNNIGKSTLLESVNLLASPYGTHSLFALLRSRDEMIHNKQDKNKSDYEFMRLFNRSDHGKSLRIESGSNYLNIDWQDEYSSHKDDIYIPPGFNVYISDSGIEEPYHLLLNTSEKIVRASEIDRLSTSLSHRPPCVFITYPSSDYTQLVSEWDKVQLTAFESHVTDFLKIIEPDVERIANQSTNARFVIKLKNYPDPIPVKSFGTGISIVLRIGLGMVQAEQGYLLVDEIDTGLHYRAITDVWRAVMEMAVRLNIQVFATTHSWDCVESFAEALGMQGNDDVGALFRLERRENDQIAAVKYTADELSVATRQSIEVR